MKAPRIFLVITLVFFTAFRLAAADFGLEFYNNSAYSDSGDWTFSQRDKATLWFSMPLGSQLSIYVSAVYEFSGLFSTNPADIGFLARSFDAGRIALEGYYPAVFGPSTFLTFKLGRIAMQDFSEKIVSGLNDGLSAELANNNSLFKFSLGFTGLLDKNDALNLIDDDDQTVFFDTEKYFAAPRIIGELGYSISELFTGHDLGIEAWAQFDVKPDGIKTNTFYIQPHISGSIGRTFRWNAWGIYELGYDTAWFSAFASGGRIRATIPEAMFLKLSASLVWASGVKEFVRAYTPIRQSMVASAYPALFSDILVPKLEAGFAPFSGFTVNAGGSLFVRAEEFMGGEISGNVFYKAASDLNFSLGSAIFFPDTSGVSAAAQQSWTISLGISLNF